MKLSNKSYDTLKKVALYVLPALATLILGIGQVWNFPMSDEIAQTIALIVTFIDTCLGGLLNVSSHIYWEEKENKEVG